MVEEKTRKAEGRRGVALIGCGGIAGIHLQAIAQEPRVRLIAVADMDAKRAQAAAEKYGADEVHGTWGPIWRNAEIEAVDLCLPHHLHAPAAIAAMEAGKHVLVEKPIANTVAEAEAMIEAARTHERILMVGHVKRFNRAAVTMQRAIAAGQIGEPFSFEAIWYGPREIMPGIPWVQKKAQGGGGPLMGFGTHHLDLLRWFFGEVAEVAAFTTRGVMRDAEVEDTAAVSLRFRSGAPGVSPGAPGVSPGVIGVLHFSWTRTVESFCEHLRVLGTTGEVVVTDGEAVTMASETRFGDRELHALDPAEEAGDLPEEAFAAQFAHFIDCIETGATPLTDAASARNTVAVIEAAYESAESGRVVTVKY